MGEKFFKFLNCFSFGLLKIRLRNCKSVGSIKFKPLRIDYLFGFGHLPTNIARIFNFVNLVGEAALLYLIFYIYQFETYV